MIEHRLIERMIKLMGIEISNLREGKAPDMIFFDAAMDFIASYADKCHHGKEEDILFKALGRKEISDTHKGALQGLIAEHIYGRKTLNSLISSKERYLNGENSGLIGIIKFAEELINFYPKHIEKEDKHFFIPVMEYFSKEEQNKMIEEFFKFDQALIHERYKDVIEKWEERKR
ncbi:MAG: hemerythrin domain-containing protein [Candidatus Omnitrophota bacterium]